MANSLTTRKSESGRTMMEIIGVICIMGAITTTAMMWWAKAMNQQRVNTIEQEVAKRAAVYEQGTRKGFVTNMFSDQKKIPHGYGISSPVPTEGGVQVFVGQINGGIAIQQSVCELLFSRADTQRQGSAIHSWSFVDAEGHPVEQEHCEAENTMAALVSVWRDTRKRDDIIYLGGNSKRCDSTSKCGVNEECDVRHNCVPCPPGYFRNDLAASSCVAGCAVTFTETEASRPENLCRTCNQTTGELVRKNNGSTCGVGGFGVCNGDNCNTCVNWDTKASEVQKTCGKCNSTNGAYVGDSNKNGYSCYEGRGSCSGGICKCDATRHFIPNNADETKATGCVCDASLHLKDNGHGTCVCDDTRGWTADAKGTCVCKAGWTMGSDGINCTPCIIGTYKPTAGNGACKTCPGGRLTVTKGATSVDDCGCPPGQYLKNNKTCAKCNGVWDKANNIPNLYTSDPNNSASCNTCNAGNRAKEETKVINENLYTGYMSCKACGKSAEGQCGCDASKLLMPNGKGGCGCTVGAFTNEKGNVVEVCRSDEICNIDERECVKLQCGPGKYVKIRDTGKGMFDPACTDCPINTYKEGTNTVQSCTACDTANGYYTNSTGQTSCKQCSGANKQYNTSTNKCECKNGFSLSGNDCICPAGKEISGNSCVDCTSSAQGGCSCGTKYPSGGTCVECTSPSHCATGYTCNSGVCEEIKCTGGKTLSGDSCVCPTNKPYEQNGVCYECTDSSHCGSCGCCSGNSCTKVPDGCCGCTSRRSNNLGKSDCCNRQHRDEYCYF